MVEGGLVTGAAAKSAEGVRVSWQSGRSRTFGHKSRCFTETEHFSGREPRGMGYMLKGDKGASNTDPSATKPTLTTSKS